MFVLPHVVLGGKGVIWKDGGESGRVKSTCESRRIMSMGTGMGINTAGFSQGTGLSMYLCFSKRLQMRCECYWLFGISHAKVIGRMRMNRLLFVSNEAAEG